MRMIPTLPPFFSQWHPITFGRWVKASLLMSAGWITLLFVYVINTRLSIQDALWGFGISGTLVMVFVRPYLRDLANLTQYVRELALGHQAEAPSLGFLSNVEELSTAVHQLHTSWAQRQKVLEAMLAESKVLFDTLPEALLMLDMHHRIIRTNHVARTLFGEPLIGKAFNDVIHDTDCTNAIHHTLETGIGKDINLYLPIPHDHYFIARIERFPTYSPDGICTLVILHNITTLKHTERMMADFVANASHQIRTPLTSLIGCIETLRTTAREDIQAQEMFLDLMTEQGEIMAKLISDLLSLSKIERHLHTPPTEHVSIAHVVNKVVRQLSWEASNQGIRCLVECPETLPDVVGDTSELILAVHNILHNAIKYANPNTDIMIRIALQRGQIPPSLTITIEDQGEGIPHEYLARLTERFYRVPSPRTHRVKGSGLGLAIVQHILQRHRGQLHIESTVGKGSCFTIQLPL